MRTNHLSLAFLLITASYGMAPVTPMPDIAAYRLADFCDAVTNLYCQ